MTQLKVALVHDYLRGYGDAERVLEGLHHLYPQAPIYTAFVDRPRIEKNSRFTNWDIRPTFAQKLPSISQCHPLYRPLLPYVWESLDLSGYDLVVSSSSSALSHGVLTESGTLHVCYCHTPARWLWDTNRQTQHFAQAWLDSHLRQYDFYAAQRVDRFVTNSERVARRIRKIYRKPAEVIPPPVPIEGSGAAGERYFLYIGALDCRTQVDLAIQACTNLDRPLKVIGKGPDEARLRQMAGETVEFLGYPPAEELNKVFANTMALLFPQLDSDFGFIPIEAMGRGIPVIAYRHSGMAEIVLHYRTGLLFEQPNVECLGVTIEEFEKMRFVSQACIDRAREFSEAVFTSKFDWYVAQAMDDHR